MQVCNWEGVAGWQACRAHVVCCLGFRPQAMSSRGRSEIDPKGGQEYAAAAMSLVFHSAHPLVPTLRADVRLFQVRGPSLQFNLSRHRDAPLGLSPGRRVSQLGVGAGQERRLTHIAALHHTCPRHPAQVAGKSWYGGGCDLTPFYVDEQDAREFHAYWRRVCEAHQPGQLYPRLKQWCDKYFYIPARKEHRGLGGLFFDDLAAEECGFDAAAFTRDVGDGILPSWEGIARRRGGLPFTQQQRDWQLLRRGRYLVRACGSRPLCGAAGLRVTGAHSCWARCVHVTPLPCALSLGPLSCPQEFNLLYDRGVKFGLDGGRIESIMVSAPPLIAWK